MLTQKKTMVSQVLRPYSVDYEVIKWEFVIDAVHLWQDLDATDAIHLNEVVDARGADALPTGWEAVEEGTELSADAAEGKQRGIEPSYRSEFSKGEDDHAN